MRALSTQYRSVCIRQQSMSPISMYDTLVTDRQTAGHFVRSMRQIWRAIPGARE